MYCLQWIRIKHFLVSFFERSPWTTVVILAQKDLMIELARALNIPGSDHRSAPTPLLLPSQFTNILRLCLFFSLKFFRSFSIQFSVYEGNSCKKRGYIWYLFYVSKSLSSSFSCISWRVYHNFTALKFVQI